jgi:hypothetical protein
VAVTPEGSYALARTRVLAADGQPIEGVTTIELSPTGTNALPATLADGYLSLGGTPGIHTGQFIKGGHLPVWRRAALC